MTHKDLDDIVPRVHEIRMLANAAWGSFEYEFEEIQLDEFEDSLELLDEAVTQYMITRGLLPEYES